MADKPKPISFHLPNAEKVEGYVVELPGGKKVMRTREELTRDPRQPQTVQQPQPKP